ncbi:MAG: hypothetical protein ACJ736_14110, partial [Streptomyces sp.]
MRQMTCSGLLAGALTELLDSTGVLEAVPLAEVALLGVVSGGVGVVGVGVSEGFAVSDADDVGVLEPVDVEGVGVEGLGVVGFGDVGVPLLPGPFVPLAVSEGSAAPVGVGS